MHRFLLLFTALVVSACTGGADHLGNPLLLPGRAISNAISEGAYTQRRGAVEVFVKTNHPALIRDIQAGGGATLTQAMDIAQVPPQNRAGLILDLRSDLGLYAQNLDAMVVTLMVYA